MNRLLAPGREIFRWYLRKFPLRDGKASFYRWLAPRLTPKDRFVTITMEAGFRLNLDLQDEVQHKMYFFGEYDERYEARMLRRLLAPHEVFYDVGANIGYFTLLAATALQHTGQVAAFEPGQESFASLRGNLALNPYGNILVYKVAVTDREGEATLFSSRGGANGCASLYAGGPEPKNREVCRTVALDGFAAASGLPAPDFIKIDVEGAELSVLKGAGNLLAHHQPLLLLEMKEATLTAAGTNKREIQEFLTGFGYQPAFPYRRRWHRGHDVTGIRSRNILWFDPHKEAHQAKMARLPLLGLG